MEVGTLIPFGRRGVFRNLNSGMLNRLVGRVVGHDCLRSAEERLGMGNTI